MSTVCKGTISSFTNDLDQNSNKTRARVLPSVENGTVTQPFIIPWFLRGDMGKLTQGQEVICAVFDDGSGMILLRADGEWGGLIPWNLMVLGDVQAGNVSLKSHTHSTPEGESGSPH